MKDSASVIADALQDDRVVLGDAMQLLEEEGHGGGFQQARAADARRCGPTRRPSSFSPK
jgi:hypothetical protein